MNLALRFAIAAYTLSGLWALVQSFRAKPGRRLSLTLLALGGALNLYWVIARWADVGYPPFAELEGCLVLMALSIAAVAFSLETLVRARFVGALSTLAAAALVVFSSRFAGEVRQLPPALASPYFAPHVLSYFIAYGALTIAGLSSVAYLVARLFTARDSRSRFPADAQAVTWRAVTIGFPFLTLGLVLGAFWAQAAYTDYWSWDPKEVWALITWLMVAAHFHLNLSGRRGVGAAALMVLAVGALFFTLFGVPYLPASLQSLHSYTMP